MSGYSWKAQTPNNAIKELNLALPGQPALSGHVGVSAVPRESTSRTALEEACSFRGTGLHSQMPIPQQHGTLPGVARKLTSRGLSRHRLPSLCGQGGRAMVELSALLKPRGVSSVHGDHKQTLSHL